MKKLFSIVLMGAALLVSTNAKAAEYNPTDWDELKAALDQVLVDGDENVINLQADITIPGTYNILYGTTKAECMDMYTAHLVLNLNGHVLDNNGYSGPVFNVFNGSLELAGTGKIESNTSNVIDIRGYADNKMSYSTKVFQIPAHNIFWNAGEGPRNYSELIVGQNVTLHMTKSGKEGGEKVIYVDGVRAAKTTQTDSTTKYSTATTFGAKTIPYQTGYASQADRKKVSTSASFYGMGINIEIAGKVISNGNRCIQINGSNRECLMDANKVEITEGRNVPVITIASTAQLTASDTLVFIGKAGEESNPAKWESCPAIYAAGYAEWHIYGSVIGEVGIYAKSGDFDIKDAEIKSNAISDYVAPSYKGSGTAGGNGSAIVFDSNSKYAQEMSATISGNTIVTGASGFAIEEKITQGDDKIVETGQLVISGGEFNGGEAGCLEVEAELGAQIKTEGSITAGTFSDTEALKDLLDDVHGTITVTKGESGEDVYVVTPKAEPGAVIPSDPNNAGATDLVEMKKDTTAEISGEVENGYLKLTHGADVVVKTGARYTVGGMALDENSTITVEPGAELVIMEDGITAFSTKNIVLQANATKQGVLLLNPAVTGNTAPYATMQMVSNIGKDGADEYWGRFGIGVTEMTKATRVPAVTPYFVYWDYATNKWADLINIKTAKPFVGYAVTQGSTLQDITFTFEGKLFGNNDQPINCASAANGWNYLANSYTGVAGTKSVLSNLDLDAVDGSVYIWDAKAQNWKTVTLEDAEAGSFQPGAESIKPFQTMIFRSNIANAKIQMDYSEAVWDYAFPSSSAPVRKMTDNNKAFVVITAENGQSDYVSLTEGAQFDDEYNNGADAVKYMNEKHINAYAMVNGEKQAAVATNNIEGTMISLETVEGINYTMSFNCVKGETYAIKDMVTGQVIAMEEGNVYNFVANENAVNAGRFQVVSGRTVATGVDNINAAAVKGVYSVLGQRVGTTENYNALPAGIYVVDGVKVVKK